jgi:Phage integrase family
VESRPGRDSVGPYAGCPHGLRLIGSRSGEIDPREEQGNVRERVLDAGARLASEKLIENGLPQLPHVTPHTMRRTYVSVMLLATNFDVSFVQSQVGHTDSKLTMDVYAQLLDRSKRAHGAAFDALLADAQETLYGAQSGDFGPSSDFGLSADISPSSEFGSDTGENVNGRGGFRTCDLSRVKRDGKGRKKHKKRL